MIVGMRTTPEPDLEGQPGTPPVPVPARWKHLLRFIGIGLLFATFPGEISNQLLIHRDPHAFVVTLLNYVWFLALAYRVSRRLEQRHGSRWKGRLRFYLIYGCVGVAIEWFLLGVYPFVPSPVQLMLFSFWSGMVLTPCIFTDEPETPELRLLRCGLRRYLAGWAGVALLPFVAAYLFHPGHTEPFRNFSMLAFGLGVLGVNVYFYRYFRLLRAASRSEVPAESPALVVSRSSAEGF